MFVTFRSVLLVFAALSASSVAPAQVRPAGEPLIPLASASVPKIVTPEPLVVLEQPVAPEATVEVDIETEAAAAKPEIVKSRGNLQSMVAELRSSDPGSRELECLAVGIYFESKSEPLSGQLAVGHVIADRAASGRFARTYCGVLFQRGQFSFVRGGKLPSVPRASKQWQTAVAVAKIVDADLHVSPTPRALFFHAKRVSPGWRLKRVASVGNHIFYR